MANLDCLGQGPKERMLRGREVVYPREALLEWIAGRLQAIPSRNYGQVCEWRCALRIREVTDDACYSINY